MPYYKCRKCNTMTPTKGEIDGEPVICQKCGLITKAHNYTVYETLVGKPRGKPATGLSEVDG